MSILGIDIVDKNVDEAQQKGISAVKGDLNGFLPFTYENI